MNSSHKKISKLLSYVLRHNPDHIGITLDKNGWVTVAELIEKINATGTFLDKDLLQSIVADNDKRRFAFDDTQTLIRASQGHSIEVDLQMEAATPPAHLYHGTADRLLESILADGLQKRSRQHVHLSDNIDTAKAVGGRHGKPIVLIIDAKAMQEAGYLFYLSANKVWLTDEVPARFIKVEK